MGKPLGSGGFGEVFAARRKKDNLPVSINKPLIYNFYRVVFSDVNYSLPCHKLWNKLHRKPPGVQSQGGGGEGGEGRGKGSELDHHPCD